MKRFKQFILEASEGEAKWNKYFVSNTDVSTKVKKSNYLYTLDGEKTFDRVNSGDLITVKSNQNYNTKPIITYNKDEYRLPLTSIEKPIIRKVSFQLKPDRFGIGSNIPVKKCPKELAKYLNINYKPIKTSKDLLDLEKLVIKTLNDSIGKDKWTKLVRLAIKELYIVKMHIDKNGKPIFEGAKKGLDINEVYWRSKNSPNHWDRIGFQL